MQRHGTWLRLTTFTIVLLLLAACGQKDSPASFVEPPAALEAAVLSRDWEQVEAAAANGLRSARLRREAAILRGYASLARGDFGSAVGHFLRARSGKLDVGDMRWAEALGERHPNQAVAQLLSGDARARQGDRHAGMLRLDAALALDPDLAVARVARGILRAMLGERTAALQDLNVLAMHSPVAAEALVARGLVHLEMGRLDRALGDVNQALDLAPEHAIGYNARGIIYAQRGEWVAAAQNFEVAFRLAPELVEARQNWQVARRAAEQRGAVLREQWHLGVFGTGILSEADFKYARTHARDLVPGREHAYVYLAYKGEMPLGGVEKMRQHGVPVIIADPSNPQAAVRQLDQFFKQSIDSGKNPIIFSDINKWVPSQLGNTKEEALKLPAQILAEANAAFYHNVSQRGDLPISTFAAHSDGTKVELMAAVQAQRLGAPITRAIVESPRQEAELDWGVRRAPGTHFTVVQPIRGDLFTSEAQGRFARGEPGAYAQTIERFKNISAPNYDLALITNPSRSSPSLLHPGGAHSDPANLDRFTKVEFYHSGKLIDNRSGPLGQLLSQTSIEPPQARLERSPAMQPGGILVGPVNFERGADSRIIFGFGGRGGGGLTSVYPLFGVPKDWPQADRTGDVNN